ncbi:MAG: amino acid permease, partial [Candidatus Bathyarchaeia archaeon]
MSKKVIVRESSGLVRNISAWDALILNVMFMAPTAVFVYGIWASAIYPGVHLPTTALLAIPISIIVGLFYAVYSAAMPRSGGDYIWVSRILHPALGFMINFFIFMVLLSVAGAYVPWFTQWALAPILQFNGYEAAAKVVASNEFTFLAAIIIYLIFAVIVSRGAKATAAALWILFSLVFIGLIAYSAVLLSLGPERFMANFNAKSGLDYFQVIEAAKNAGYPGTFLVSATLLGLVFTYMNFIGFNSSVYAAGEIKEVQKSQIIAITGSIIVFGFITWLAYQITYYGMGGIFIGALSYLWAIGDPAYKLPFADGPFFPFLFQYATDSKLLYTFVMICWSA